MRVAVYAGTFDPITTGHLSVIERAARLFDQLVVLVAVNPSKSPMFSLNERIAMIGETTAHVANVACEGTGDLVVACAKARGAVALIRGIRGATDAEYEIELAQTNRLLAPEMTTLFIPADPHLSEVSSSQLKDLAAQGMDVRRYAPASVLRRLVARAAQTSTEETVHGSL